MISDDQLLEFYKMKNLVRYNHRVRIKDESVAEHSYYVTLFTLIICDKYNIIDNIKLKCLEKATLHDISEIITSDIPHDVKENSKVIKDELKRIDKKYIEDNFKEYQYNVDIVDSIISLADAYSVKQYCMVEMNLGNSMMEIIFQDSIERINNHTRDIEKILGGYYAKK